MKISGSTLYHRVCYLIFFFLVAAASFNGSFDKWRLSFFDKVQVNLPIIGACRQDSPLDAVVDGTAARPFIYRQLLPQVAKHISDLVSEPVKSQLLVSNGNLTNLGQMIDAPLARDPRWFLTYWIVYALVFLSAWAAAIFLFESGKALGLSSPAAALAAAALILMIPYFQTDSGYYYDYPELAFCALSVWVALRCRWWWLVPVAVLGTWNKETFAIFVVMLYPLLRMRLSRKRATMATTVTVVACAAAFSWPWILFHRNFNSVGGSLGSLRGHIQEHIQFVWDFFRVPYFESTYHLPENNLFTFLMLGLIAWTAWRGWRYLPRQVQIHAKIGALINVPLYVFFCSPGEWRDFGLLYFSLFFLIAVNIAEWMSLPPPVQYPPARRETIAPASN